MLEKTVHFFNRDFVRGYPKITEAAVRICKLNSRSEKFRKIHRSAPAPEFFFQPTAVNFIEK